MNAAINSPEGLSPEIRAVADRLVALLSPRIIYLYNERVDAVGCSTGFKLCVVAEMADKQEAEKSAYMTIDCEIPFDLLLYTPAEWEEITGRESSFAQKIQTTGKIIYG